MRNLAALLAALAGGRGPIVQAFGDLAELGPAGDTAGLLVLDADAASLEDLGYVRRFLAAQPGVALVLCGADPGARVARSLASASARRWVAWPPDVEELRALLAAAQAGEAVAPPPAPRPTAAPPASAPAAPPGDELEAVRAILAGAGAGTANAEPAEEAPPSEAPAGEGAADEAEEPDVEPDADATAEVQDEPVAGGLLHAPVWLRAQVADLADAAQRIDLSLRALAEAAPDVREGDADEPRERFRELELEIERLAQYARTLGCLVAPPAQGSQVFDLAEIAHLFASGLAASGPDAPRCQYKAGGAVHVRSDRHLLGQALDALFFLARSTSRKGDLVRAQVRRAEAPGGAIVELRLEFPSGPLEGVPQAEIIAPYALRDLFPDLGPNALAAAAGIVAGQGGHLSLAAPAPGRLEWRLDLPGAPGR
jgi:hypothetical protein